MARPIVIRMSERKGRQLADACLWNVREERRKIEEREERRTVYEGEVKSLMIRMGEQEWIINGEMIVEYEERPYETPSCTRKAKPISTVLYQRRR